MKRSLGWKRLDTIGAEEVEIATDPLTIAGEVVCFDEGRLMSVSYGVLCNDRGETVSASIRRRSLGETRAIQLIRDDLGGFTINGKDAPSLHGIVDVDISVTPSTNLLPIRRFALAVGESREAIAAWVRFPDLDVLPLRHIYRRIDRHRYLYQSVDHDFSAELTVDAQGVVVDYEKLWTRIE